MKSYVELIKKLKGTEVSFKNFKEVFQDLELEEALEEEFNGFPVEVKYINLPIVVGEDITVKLVLLEQGENFAIILPENVAEVFQKLKEEEELLPGINLNFSLVVENIGFEEGSSFYALIRKAYLSSGQYAPAFDIKGIKEVSEEEETEEEREHRSSLGGGDFRFNNKEVEIEDDILDTPDLQESKQALLRFKKQTNYLEGLLLEIEKSPKVLIENIKVSLINKSLLAITVNNKAIYEELNVVPKAAKGLITSFGEKLKAHKNVQLVNTFATKEGGRTFIVAEAAGNNYWVSEEDNLQFTLKSGLVEVDNKDLIILNKTSIRIDERKRKPFVAGEKILFEDLEV